MLDASTRPGEGSGHRHDAVTGAGARRGTGGLAAWAERTGRGQVRAECRGGLRFAFYGRVSTEDHQDPVTSLARQLDQAGALVAGHGRSWPGSLMWGRAGRWPGRCGRSPPSSSPSSPTLTAAGTRS
jgi:hypothetical protein